MQLNATKENKQNIVNKSTNIQNKSNECVQNNQSLLGEREQQCINDVNFINFLAIFLSHSNANFQQDLARFFLLFDTYIKLWFFFRFL